MSPAESNRLLPMYTHTVGNQGELIQWLRDFGPKVDPVRQISVLFLFVHSMSTFYIMFTPTYAIILCSLIFSVPCLFCNPMPCLHVMFSKDHKGNK